jgi:hypothetical protein
MNAPVRWRLLVDRPIQQVDYAAVATGTDDDAAEDDGIPF